MSKETVNQENEAPKIIMIIIIEIFKSENKKNLEGNINNSDINYVIINKRNDYHIINDDNTNWMIILPIIIMIPYINNICNCT